MLSPVIKSTDSPRQPTARRLFASPGDNNAGLSSDFRFSARRRCNTLALKRASYRFRTPKGTGVGRLLRLGKEGGRCVCDPEEKLCVVALLRMDDRSDEREGGGGADLLGTYGVGIIVDDVEVDKAGRLTGELGMEPELVRETGLDEGGVDRIDVRAEFGRSGSFGG